jgi:hypothetical protein
VHELSGLLLIQKLVAQFPSKMIPSVHANTANEEENAKIKSVFSAQFATAEFALFAVPAISSLFCFGITLHS